MSTADRVFLDTNILVYGELPASPFHDAVKLRLAELEASGSELWTSRQVLREFLAVMSRGTGLSAIPPMAALLADVAHFSQRLMIAEDGPATTLCLSRLLSVVPCAGKQIHDANVVATMMANNIQRLLTHDVAHFQRFASHVSVESLIS
jgi:predicted nucleic acid-binding protein